MNAGKTPPDKVEQDDDKIFPDRIKVDEVLKESEKMFCLFFHSRSCCMLNYIYCDRLKLGCIKAYNNLLNLNRLSLYGVIMPR